MIAISEASNKEFDFSYLFSFLFINLVFLSVSFLYFVIAFWAGKVDINANQYATQTAFYGIIFLFFIDYGYSFLNVLLHVVAPPELRAA